LKGPLVDPSQLVEFDVALSISEGDEAELASGSWSVRWVWAVMERQGHQLGSGAYPVLHPAGTPTRTE